MTASPHPPTPSSSSYSPLTPVAKHSPPPPTPTPTAEVTSRTTTDGTKYLPESYETTDGTVEIPHPMIDPQGVRRKLPTDWPLGDPRRRDE